MGRREVTVTPHLVAQARRVAELIDAGYGNARIAIDLGVSRPRVSQIRRELAALEPYLGRPQTTDRLRGHREQLWSLRHDALRLAAAVRRDLRELDEELQAADIDQALGLRG
jgi:predicted transcriptional regulator